MQITAKVTIQNSTYDTWYDFYLSYSDKRGAFIKNEIIEKVSETEAKVSFEIIDYNSSRSSRPGSLFLPLDWNIKRKV